MLKRCLVAVAAVAVLVPIAPTAAVAAAPAQLTGPERALLTVTRAADALADRTADGTALKGRDGKAVVASVRKAMNRTSGPRVFAFYLTDREHYCVLAATEQMSKIWFYDSSLDVTYKAGVFGAAKHGGVCGDALAEMLRQSYRAQARADAAVLALELETRFVDSRTYPATLEAARRLYDKVGRSAGNTLASYTRTTVGVEPGYEFCVEHKRGAYNVYSSRDGHVQSGVSGGCPPLPSGAAS